MIPRDYQAELADEGAVLLRKYMILYLAMEERTGKSLIGLLIAEMLDVQNILIITKKKALGSLKEEEGWINLLDKFEHEKNYTLTTYGKAKAGNYDLIILDEAHNYISGYPKPSSTWQKIRRVCKGTPIIYMSATPHAQGYQLLYHQFALSTWGPWHTYTNFYNWFQHYGIPYTIKIGYGDDEKEVNQYDKVDNKLIEACVEHLFITKTRKELGFEFEPEDELHYIELNDVTKQLYNSSMADRIFMTDHIMKLLDTSITLRTSLHMIEGGTMKNTMSYAPEEGHILRVDKEKIEDQILFHAYYDLPESNEKLEYILATWGDSDEVAIMYNYIGEGIKLRAVFKNAQILQATSNAEGVELSHIRHLVIYSQDFSTARHTQRRARQASMQREWDIRVHFLLTKKAVSCQVYKTVSLNKVNFVDSRFEREIL